MKHDGPKLSLVTIAALSQFLFWATIAFMLSGKSISLAFFGLMCTVFPQGLVILFAIPFAIANNKKAEAVILVSMALGSLYHSAAAFIILN